MSTVKFYQPIASVNDTPVALAGFSYKASQDILGAIADITLADVETEVERGDSFGLLIKCLVTGDPKSNLIKNGRVVGFGKSIGSRRVAGLTAPNDSLSFKAVDKSGDTWKLTPRTPLILFDPQYLTIDENEADTNINDEDGNRILATITPVNYLDLEALLAAAYVDGIGFTEIIHNLPNYRIPRVDFALSTSYHSAAAPYYAMFKPLIFEDDDRLFILDVFGEIPEGVLTGARSVQLSKLISFDFTKPESQIVNAVLLTHKEISVQSLIEDEFPDNVTQRQEYEERNVGVPFSAGWQRTRFTRFIAEIHDDEDDPAKITSEVVWKTETRTSGYDESGTFRELSRETQEDRYSNSWRLKLGFTKTVEAYVENGSGSKLMQNVYTEQNTLQWKPSITRPGEWEKFYSETQVEGLVLIEGDDPDFVYTPILDASRNKDIPDDGSLDIERMPISSQIEVWRYTGADQIEVHIQKIDQLNHRLETGKTVEHVGTNAVRVRDGAAFNTKQVLLVDEASDLADGAREPITFDAGFLPYAIGKELAFRELANVREPKPVITCQLATYDAGIRRGSVRKLFFRDGSHVRVIVTGFEVTGTPRERGQLLIGQTITGVVLSAAA
jgi:hypothetical protein